MITIDLERFEAFIFDLDGVITQTASIHARAWKQLFDEFLARQAAQTGASFVPFDLEIDYRRYVDGKPRVAGVLSFLAARNIKVPMEELTDRTEQDSAHDLARRKDSYFQKILTQEGVQVFDSAVALRWMEERGKSFGSGGPSSRAVPVTSRRRPRTASPTGTVIGFPVVRTGTPRFSPAVP